jgi:hypothetical protein
MTSATVYLAADHGGFELKNQLVEYLRDQSVAARDLGPDEYDKDDDYPDYALKLVKALRTDAGSIEQGPVMLLVTRAAPMFIWSTSILKPGKYFEMFTLARIIYAG